MTKKKTVVAIRSQASVRKTALYVEPGCTVILDGNPYALRITNTGDTRVYVVHEFRKRKSSGKESGS